MRPRRSISSLSPWTTRSPRFTRASLREPLAPLTHRLETSPRRRDPWVHLLLLARKVPARCVGGRAICLDPGLSASSTAPSPAAQRSAAARIAGCTPAPDSSGAVGSASDSTGRGSASRCLDRPVDTADHSDCDNDRQRDEQSARVGCAEHDHVEGERKPARQHDAPDRRCCGAVCPVQGALRRRQRHAQTDQRSEEEASPP